VSPHVYSHVTHVRNFSGQRSDVIPARVDIDALVFLTKLIVTTTYNNNNNHHHHLV